MTVVAITDFRKNASGFISQVEQGETIILVRRGKPVAEIVPIASGVQKTPTWKQPSIQIQLKGNDLSSAILEEREDER